MRSTKPTDVVLDCDLTLHDLSRQVLLPYLATNASAHFIRFIIITLIESDRKVRQPGLKYLVVVVI